MNITFAQTFLEVLASGNLNRAAERLNVTQSTVTTRINALEAELGQQLLVRNRSGAQVTAAGFKFQRFAEMLVQTWKQARHEISLPKAFESACTIACHFELWDGVVEGWCTGMRKHNPQVALSVWPGEHADINRWLDSGLVDAALVLDVHPRNAWSVRALMEDQLIQVATRQRDVMRWDPDYVYVDHGADFRRQHAAAYPVEETAAVSFGHSAWALKFILKHGGSGYLPARVVSEHLAAGRLYRVNGAVSFARTAYLVSNDAITRDWPWFEKSFASGNFAFSQDFDPHA